jgi:hypothetical protein
MENQPAPTEQPQVKEPINIVNGASVPLVGGPGNGRRIEFQGIHVMVPIHRKPSILTANNQTFVEEHHYVASVFKVGSRVMAIYRHETLEEEHAFMLVFQTYGMFDVENPRGSNARSKGKGVH